MYDSCSCEKSEECMCGAVSAYVYACSAAGIHIRGWRSTICGALDTCDDTRDVLDDSLAHMRCPHVNRVVHQAPSAAVQQILCTATTWPPVAVLATPSVRPTTPARSDSVPWMVAAVPMEATWMKTGCVCSGRSVPATIKTLSLMLERPTAKTESHGKCVQHLKNSWLQSLLIRMNH